MTRVKYIRKEMGTPKIDPTRNQTVQKFKQRL
jgi:hypothetical protein